MSQDHPSATSRFTPKSYATPRRHHKYDTDDLPSQPIKIGYQKVTLDIDLAEQSVLGETELTVLPLNASVRQVKLDCRGMQIKDITVNGKKASYHYGDFFQNDEYLNDTENPVLANYEYNPNYDTHSEVVKLQQHHFYRARFYPLFSDQNNQGNPSSSYPENTSELVIYIPDSIKLRLHDPTSKQTFSPNVSSTRSHTPLTTNAMMSSDKVYTPLNIKISYLIRNSKNGLLFHGGNGTTIPKNRWFCYTSNNDLGCSASSWVPCIDNFYEKPAWDINIIVPETVGDIGETKLVGSDEAKKALRRMETEDEMDEEQEERDDTPLIVAVPDLIGVKESPSPLDVGKKVINFQFYNPVPAHHLGFAVGAFESCPILDVKPGTDELVPSNALANFADKDINNATNFSTESNSNKVPTMLYFLPGRKEEVLNTTVAMYKMFDFYSKEFGSFPFPSYTMVYVDDMACDSCAFAGMTIMSSKLLYSPKLIEPIFDVTEKLAVALSEQYSGINVLPKSLNDFWLVIGISYFMAGQFLKKLFGVNRYRYEVKLRTDYLCEIDVGKRPLANQLFRFPINLSQDMEFIRLKAPLIMFILDRRMTKTDKSFGLSRVIPKIFLQAMSGDLLNGNCLSTAHFHHVCEKVAHHKLESFFQNWIHSCGVPIFQVTQRFNKKRMFIEMSIRQIQKNNKLEANDELQMDINSKETLRKQYQREHFVDEANMFLSEEETFSAPNVFTGPITIRIHEADGTPYEHIVDIKDPVTKLDIQYNTKYRRSKRRKEEDQEEAERKEREREKRERDKLRKEREKDKLRGDDDEPTVKKLGDVFMKPKDLEDWGFAEKQKIEENDYEILGDAFEWLRVDADFEWICKVYINLNENMFESQLRQDRDVEAQLESVKFFSESLHPSIYFATVLMRTILDKRYFYGVRAQAALGLAKLSKEDNDHLGMRFLLKAYKYFYCYNNIISKGYPELEPNEYLPLPNDFSEFSDYFVMKAIVTGLSTVTNKNGDSPIELKRIMLNILKFNDNNNNYFDDSFYLANFITCLSNLIVSSNKKIPNHNESHVEMDKRNLTDPTEKFLIESIVEINRAAKMDQWSPSYHHIVTVTMLHEKVRLALLGLVDLSYIDLIPYTRSFYDSDIRLKAFESLLLLGGLRNSHVLSLLFTTLKLETSHYLRHHLILALMRAVGAAAVDGVFPNLEDDEFFRAKKGDSDEKNNTLVIVENSGAGNEMKTRRDQLSRLTMKGALEILRRDLSIGTGLRKELWLAIHSCLLSVSAKRNLFDVIEVVFEAIDSFKVTTKLPNERKLVAKVTDVSIEPHSETYKVTFKRQGRLKIQIPTIKLKVTDNSSSRSTQKQKRSSVSEPSSDPRAPREKFEVKFKYRKLSNRRRVAYDIIQTDKQSPLRYVRFQLFEKKVLVSDDENFGELKSLPVKLKINPEKLRQLNPVKTEPSTTLSAPESAPESNGYSQHGEDVQNNYTPGSRAEDTSEKIEAGDDVASNPGNSRSSSVNGIPPLKTEPETSGIEIEASTNSERKSTQSRSATPSLPKIKLKLK
ncbi:hypothetical protein KL935_005384 [Ogataea polymorpha]|uniref:Transcription initiation factor TFIID subunit 2 n=1 Tax=Ogataea polymorpha TaxID=460523 RepID=A0A9P8T024_9ASCO|nr:hypothetical protein KL908_001798 [Ogataea polymorpha]KAG7897232.1 hypothetical protein KL935_005384 [Ogataea polymorpha]KAH3660991.1 hypothetical protein OGATHE_005323 [Ogataea polymorpha]